MTQLTPAQIVALAFGVVYLMVGLVGFAVTGFDGWVSSADHEKLLFFPLNPLHNFVHIGLGLGWMFSTGKHVTSAKVNLIFGVVLLLVAALGFAGVLDFLAIPNSSSADNFLHLVTGVVSLYFGTLGSQARWS